MQKFRSLVYRHLKERKERKRSRERQRREGGREKERTREVLRRIDTQNWLIFKGHSKG